MKFIADLHIHSKFSMATARNLDFENLYLFAQLKGITVVGTGDVTHPGWFSEIEEKLVPAEPGLFKLKDAIARNIDAQVPAACKRPVRFLLSCEISNIYKKNGRTRKNHNLVFLPDLDAAAIFNKKLGAVGNITADGRPILGLDAKHLLEMLLESSDKSFLIPAHIWTPWFSLLGSKSGFDHIEECFEELTQYIFAVETGLSSDPAMNWRVSGLDGLTLVSNSDAHSPQKLGREANLLNTTLSYDGIRSAIETADPDSFLGTFEFYPEEGKYHLDGHRNCQVCFHPSETDENDGICPVCRKPLTYGVLYRVQALSDRQIGEKPEKTHPFVNVVPLTDILSEIFQVGPNTKKVRHNYHAVIGKLGSEFDILTELSVEKISTAGIPLLSAAIGRMRDNRITLIPGYDGEYGRIRIFTPQERQEIMGQRALFSLPDSCGDQNSVDGNPARKNLKKAHRPPVIKYQPDKCDTLRENDGLNSLGGLNNAQHRAVTHLSGPLLISAGPGTGKTRTLTHRIAYLIQERNVLPQQILALTFTHKAAHEMEERLEKQLKIAPPLPWVSTFHSFCLRMLLEMPDRRADGVIDDDGRDYFLHQAVNIVKKTGAEKVSLPFNRVRDAIVYAKQKLKSPGSFCQIDDSKNNIITDIYKIYQRILSVVRRFDYEDIIFELVERLSQQPFRSMCRERFKYIFIDEYQDLNYGQYRLITALAPPDKDLCVIGDPNQSIYGFRGSDASYFERFLNDYPMAAHIRLNQNYRSTQMILDVAREVIKPRDHSMVSPCGETADIFSELTGTEKVGIFETGSSRSEAQAVSGIIENIVGGSGYHHVDTGRVTSANLFKAFSFSDIAVLYRTDRQHLLIADALAHRGIPFQVASRTHQYGVKEIRQLLSIFNIISGVGTYVDFHGCCCLIQPGLTEQTADHFVTWAIDHGLDLKSAMKKSFRFPIPGMGRSRQIKLTEFIKKLVEFEKQTAPMRRHEKIQYLILNTDLDAAAKDSPAVKEKLDHIIILAKEGNTKNNFSELALQTDTDIYESLAERVSLMTIHAAKGLEFPVVFVVGCEEDGIPFRRNDHERVNRQEERRLFYVAITRAKRRLYLSWARNSVIYGKKISRKISSFVSNIDPRLMEKQTPTKRFRKSGPTQMKLF